jgi:hypothetical protein
MCLELLWTKPWLDTLKVITGKRATGKSSLEIWDKLFKEPKRRENPLP